MPFAPVRVAGQVHLCDASSVFLSGRFISAKALKSLANLLHTLVLCFAVSLQIGVKTVTFLMIS